MFCRHCGEEIPDKSKYCPECGGEQTGNSKSEPAQWEYCEVFAEQKTNLLKGFLGGRTWRFWAQAMGPSGVYSVGSSKEVRRGGEWLPNDNKDTVQAHRELVTELLEDGWEVTGRKGGWWNTTLRRQVTR